MSDILRLGLVQMASGPDPEANVARVRHLGRLLSGTCDLAVFPENVLCLGRGATVRAAARTMADHFAELGAICRELGLAAVFGGVPVAEGDRVMNTSLALDADGYLLARYDKMHLFRLVSGETRIDETRLYAHGPQPASFEVAGWRVGLSICYDLRFPELYRTYIPCDLLVCTAAFTALTGPPHWEVLLRARAIENLCYTAGVGQCGENLETGVANHGHSLVVGPWGEVEGCLRDREEGTLVVTLKRDAITSARERLPALEQRRFAVSEMSDLPATGATEGIDDE